MHFTKSLIGTVLLLGLTVVAADPDRNVFPDCATNCVSIAVANQTACSPSDTSCLCSSKEFNFQTTSCIQAHCTVKELLVATKLSLAQCGVPVRGRYTSIIPLRTTLFVVATLLMIIRFLNRALGWAALGWWWDDLCIIPAYIGATCFFSSSVLLYNYGLGMDIWELPFFDVTSFLHAFYYCSLTYKTEMAFTKISVCFFFLRIFPARNFQRYTWAAIVLNVVCGLTFFFVDAFQCTPVRAAWSGWSKEKPARCIDLPSAVYANGFANIALDVMMLSLPIYEVTKLKMSWGNKLNASGMFATGFLLTVVGILRNINYSKYMRTTNPTNELSVLHRWATCEVMISLICACLPDLRAVLLQTYRVLSGQAESMQAKRSHDRSYSKHSAIIVTKSFEADSKLHNWSDRTDSEIDLAKVHSMQA